MDPFAWLQSLAEYPKIYWQDRSEKSSFAGAGLGAGIPLSFGWRHFTPSKAAQWADFPHRFQFSPRLWRKIKGEENALSWEKPRILEGRVLPDREGWQSLVEKALLLLAEQKLEKCVLAREWQFQLEKPLDPWPLLAALKKRAQNAYVICIQPTPRSAFISLTPEKLFSHKANTLETEALAATQKVGEETLFDLSHPKQRREFSLVETSIERALAKISAKPLCFSAPSIRTTSGGLQHLYSRLKTKIRKGVSEDELLDALHPTAALLGFPKEEALQFLRDNEPFDRGLYGAPIGQKIQNSSTWAVGIRSCLLFESTIRLYSGVGIVAASDVDAEWKELDQKLTVFKELLL